MTEQELKEKKDELKRLRADHQRLTIEAKIEKEQKIVNKLKEAAAEAAKPPEQRAKERADREARVNALMRQQEKAKTRETCDCILQRIVFILIGGIIIIIPFLI